MKRPAEHTTFEDDGAGYLISVSDMMAGLLFVFMITLMAFVINFQQASAEFKEINQRYTNAERVRAEMLERIQQALERHDIHVEIDERHGVLRLTENAILFPTGRAWLKESELMKLSRIGEVLSDILPCYTAGDLPEGIDSASCDEDYRGRLDSVFIEGHTDNVPIRSAQYDDNWDLSAARAIFTYHELVDDNPVLAGLTNQKDQPVFSVSGYGEGRPVRRHEVPTGDSANRRIDLRFIMTPPNEDNQLVQKMREAGVK
ncbi:OmpA/MotB family protein [Thiohalobacter thiocyanaticus]|uniref:OmpA/MotB family protein n=1 Tax=Thiohalobacter thiocyanaticus TaxID=585455 RepID=UPI0018D59BF6|nr:OmpA family protein [Thiohalobacter thiocyanaticus]